MSTLFPLYIYYGIAYVVVVEHGPSWDQISI